MRNEAILRTLSGNPFTPQTITSPPLSGNSRWLTRRFAGTNISIHSRAQLQHHLWLGQSTAPVDASDQHGGGIRFFRHSLHSFRRRMARNQSQFLRLLRRCTTPYPITVIAAPALTLVTRTCAWSNCPHTCFDNDPFRHDPRHVGSPCAHRHIFRSGGRRADP